MELRIIDDSNREEILALSVNFEQEAFVASNAESLYEAKEARRTGYKCCEYGLYEGGEAVGFVLLGYHAPDGGDFPSVAKDSYYLWRFMIDESRQGKGLGNEAMKTIVEFLKTKPFGEAKYCYTSCEPENYQARYLYFKFGFDETGEMDDGEVVSVMEI